MPVRCHVPLRLVRPEAARAALAEAERATFAAYGEREEAMAVVAWCRAQMGKLLAFEVKD